jgi:hypothetical protein
MISSGSAGKTMNTFINSDSTSSAMPPRKPALTPMPTDRTDAIVAVITPSSTVPRSP